MTIAVDLAKSTFAVAMRAGTGPVVRRRLTRQQFDRFVRAQAPAHVVMEACGTAHHWARVAQGCGHRVSLLPPQYVKPYVQRHRKTDHTDAAGMLDAVHKPHLHPVVPKTVAQQELLALHRIRRHWMTSRTARINAVRGFLQELGLPIARGAKTACGTAAALLTDAATPIPFRLRHALGELLREVRELETRVHTLERQLTDVAADDPVVARLLGIPGIGVLTATALIATVGHIHAFRTARRFASWVGLTPSERSSGARRRLGGISKAGDIYLRTLLTHGARSVLRAARYRERCRRPVPALQRWALAVEQRRGHNKATVALANKLARIVWVVWSRDVDFRADPPQTVAA
ncbi:MAG TPA: IS110 family transposase [Vicinamibacterales bacterium]|nr:IS110 family transposase [Vicinamibacterales bacterium]